MSAASAGDVSQAQIAAQPLLRPGAVLENVPGLIVTQHSGEGKANQYFLRAFNLDHGTDLATEIDDMPVNMPTHAHGQGYSDLNFLIPELIGDLHFKKGPYYADEGDFATAGAVRVVVVMGPLSARRPRQPESLPIMVLPLPPSAPGSAAMVAGKPRQWSFSNVGGPR